MLIKKNLKIEQFVPCPIILKLKKQPFPFSSAYKKQNGEIAIVPPLSLLSKIEQQLLRSLPRGLKKKRLEQKEKTILRFLYSINLCNFQKKDAFFQSFFTRATIFMLIKKKKENDNTQRQRVKAKDKGSQFKIVLKSYGSQVKDVEISIIAISKITHYLNSFNAKEFKTVLTNSFNLPSFVPPLVTIKNSNSNNDFFQDMFSSFSLLNVDLKRSLDMSLLQRQQLLKNLQIPLHLSLLMEQPLIELSEFLPSKLTTKKQNKDQSAFLLSALQKKNYCNRYFFRSSTRLDKNGPIIKQVQKTKRYGTQLFTVIRSPFVFKKTREQFTKAGVSYSVTITLHSPIQKQYLIQCLSLLRLPVELEISC